MSIKEKFAFNASNLKTANNIIKNYPAGREKSAILPLLDMAQRQNYGWLSPDAMEYVANYLNMPYIRVYEIASFYSMFNLKPVGKHHIQFCRTTPCWLRGADQVKEAAEEHLGIKCGGTTKDGMFTLSEVECLGACVNAPVVQINDDYYEDLTTISMKSTIEKLREKKNNSSKNEE